MEQNSCNIKIVWEDDSILVPLKPPFLNSEHTPDHTGLPDLLAKSCEYLTPIHRLDFGVGGLLLCARTPSAAAFLSRALTEGRIQKEYLALAHGDLPEHGRLEDLLFYDRRAGKSFVVQRSRKGVKAANLSFTKIKTCATPWGVLSLLRVSPETGRTHQIRVQFANAEHPLLGDRKYGAKEVHEIGLYCARLAFPHPKTGEPIVLKSTPTGDMWDLFFEQN